LLVVTEHDDPQSLTVAEKKIKKIVLKIICKQQKLLALEKNFKKMYLSLIISSRG